MSTYALEADLLLEESQETGSARGAPPVYLLLHQHQLHLEEEADETGKERGKLLIQLKH